MDRSSNYLMRLEKIKLARQQLQRCVNTTKGGSGMSYEAESLLATLAPYPAQEEKLSLHVLQITRELVSLTRRVEKFHKSFTDMQAELSRAPGANLDKVKQREDELSSSTQAFVEEVLDKGIMSVLDELDEAIQLIDEVRGELRVLGIPSYWEVGHQWLAEVSTSISTIETHMVEWGPYLSWNF